MNDLFEAGTIIWDRTCSLQGVATGASYPCRLAGCNGIRITVRWPDGKHTHPCSKGIVARDGKWKIRSSWYHYLT